MTIRISIKNEEKDGVVKILTYQSVEPKGLIETKLLRSQETRDVYLHKGIYISVMAANSLSENKGKCEGCAKEESIENMNLTEDGCWICSGCWSKLLYQDIMGVGK